MNRTTKVILGVALTVIILCLGFIGGFAVSRAVSYRTELPGIASGGASTGDVGTKVDEVNALLQRQALKPPSETSATAGAVQGLLESNGDKYGTYFDQKHFKAFNEETQGSFGGIGVVLGENKEGQAYIVEVYPGTPAARAGIKPGDIFQAINGVKRDKWTTEEVVKRVRGDAGTTVKVVLLRPAKDGKGSDMSVSYTITREKINYPNTKTELRGKVGYIRLGQFNAKSADDVGKDVKDLTAKGAKAFVLDLRDNPGGLLDQAVAVSSLFIKDGVIVRVDERNKPEVENRATGRKITDAPLIVLINGDSASASEITAGALQDYGRAKLVGEKSFGKGSVQTIEQLPDGSAVKFTIAHYLTPKKRVIDQVGLTPDYILPMDPMKELDKKTDTQLLKAFELANAALK